MKHLGTNLTKRHFDKYLRLPSYKSKFVYAQWFNKVSDRYVDHYSVQG